MSNQPPHPSGQSDPFTVPPAAPVQPQSSGNVVLWVVLGVIGVMMLMCGGVVVALLLPAINAGRHAAQRMSRSNNAKQVALGIHNYHAAYKQLPFTVNANSDGEETIGWRIALSPFVEGQAQWEAIDSNESWASSTNMAVFQNPPLSFQSPSGEIGETGIFAIVSDESMFPPTPYTIVRFRDVTDGLANTVMMVELPNRTTVWSSTENMTPDEAFAAIASMEDAQSAHLIMADGAVRAVTNSLERELFDALVTRAGGDDVLAGLEL
ncbi:DUF1559 family PulG-like putative transporter [Novipirellula artificiosorum]|uniref:DUF1559 domain-containing protein n=1 Tax=Novipirellula artificiosorum TaxID=2528016 RepID=A0A5C6DYH2_9BACT|nr:DUF1559 domain-containing protein [Novipirellula artificiosorum]TWU41750.1 hypothetical protein Poly41_00420 [Novipirellula artificiosorum]